MLQALQDIPVIVTVNIKAGTQAVLLVVQGVHMEARHPVLKIPLFNYVLVEPGVALAVFILLNATMAAISIEATIPTPIPSRNVSQ